MALNPPKKTGSQWAVYVALLISLALPALAEEEPEDGEWMHIVHRLSRLARVSMHRQAAMTFQTMTPRMLLHIYYGMGNEALLNVDGIELTIPQYLLKQKGDTGEQFFTEAKAGLVERVTATTIAGHHPGQFVGLCALDDLPSTYTPFGDAHAWNLEELLQAAQLSFDPKYESSWLIWALIKYRPRGFSFTSLSGEVWTLESILNRELEKPDEQFACRAMHHCHALALVERSNHFAGLSPGLRLSISGRVNSAIGEIRTGHERILGNLKSGVDLQDTFHAAGHHMELLSCVSPDISEDHDDWIEKYRRGAVQRAVALLEKGDISPDPLSHFVKGVERVYLSSK